MTNSSDKQTQTPRHELEMVRGAPGYTEEGPSRFERVITWLSEKNRWVVFSAILGVTAPGIVAVDELHRRHVNDSGTPISNLVDSLPDLPQAIEGGGESYDDNQRPVR